MMKLKQKGYKMVNIKQNDNLSYFKGLDLQELLDDIEKFYLTYRSKLDFPKNVTFGVEIEYEEILFLIVSRFVKKNLHDWKSTIDMSILYGGEIISPKLSDTTDCWLELKKVCEYLKSKRASANELAGGHVHVGAHLLGSDINAWYIFLKTYAAYERILFRFFYGDKINARKNILAFAKPIESYLCNIIENIKSINYDTIDMYYLNMLLNPLERNNAINFQNVKFYDINNIVGSNTIEFRSPNGTIEEVIWQNNINTIVKLMLAAKNRKIDEDLVDYRLKQNRSYEYHKYNQFLYNTIDIKLSLEFIDLIFDNNLDKIYFLRQYLKDLKEVYTPMTVKSKRFFK